MAFDIEITDPARNDIDDAVVFIAQDSTAAAARRKAELQILILSLQEMPGRFPIIPEAPELRLPYRSVLHYSHRLIYRIDNETDTVYIVRVYHGARQPLTNRDVASPEF